MYQLLSSQTGGALRVPRMGDTLYCRYLKLDPPLHRQPSPHFSSRRGDFLPSKGPEGDEKPTESSWVGSPTLQLLSHPQRLEDPRLGWGTECRPPSHFCLEQQVPQQPCSSSRSNASLKDPGFFSQQTEVPSARYPNRETSAYSLSTFPTALEVPAKTPR